MSNILSIAFDGNLTSDARTVDFQDTQRTVYNFTVAVNKSKDKTVFIDVAYWTKLNTDDKKVKLIDLLKKGKGVSIQSNDINNTKSVNKEKKETYNNIQFIANKLSFH